jgi:hypothetical protein
MGVTESQKFKLWGAAERVAHCAVRPDLRWLRRG